ncbi:hypothetical protein HXV88_10650 [Aeromonas veronii]|uniref:hypothetical protein n=1 Tax=Aeromonas veronii TaxID=654 RepID=UPI0015CFC496|nr:hypothetical protein [Aeromonas veronii]QLH66865.1 hypothetical protein HXV88_10600 [Aeromonas veronii]QLH66875.1 hypothetical protein HXV88_10650 [Aeromonas veronii]
MSLSQKKAYFVNTEPQKNGDHEVHVAGCAHAPQPHHRKALGQLENCEQAVSVAKVFFNQSNGCYYCCNQCHTS